ncbi:MAG: cupredoxin domain-containing protein [Pseudomonadota bacterium]|nr:cupredoxin domain-containing protein [Pseudomonadota bacterium]
MKRMVNPVGGMASLGLMLAFGSAFGSEAMHSAGESVDVKLTEYKIEMPLSVAAGTKTFNVINTGVETHGFEVEGNGIEKALKPRLKKGESGSLQVTLTPGTYKVYCPVFGHKSRGMTVDLIVK